ncbi:regulatory protein RecX [Aquimarina algiphila]|uniref:hypothetical protein n=1 Tax=Aquimarina algiphila TaxID=2047982 RepID=UPI00232BD4F6|nr:hypothetical protein [Aquimarina algiphila]
MKKYIALLLLMFSINQGIAQGTGCWLGDLTHILNNSHTSAFKNFVTRSGGFTEFKTLRELAASRGLNDAELFEFSTDLAKVIDPIDFIRKINANPNLIDAWKITSSVRSFNDFSRAIDFGGSIIIRANKKLNILGRVGPRNGTIGTMQIRTELIRKGVSEDEITLLLQGIPRSNDWTELSVSAMNRRYWDEINQPHIDEIIANGGDIRFIHDPRLDIHKYNLVADMPDSPFKQKCIAEGISKIRTFTNMEYQYLVGKGYTLQENGLMIKL